MVGVLRECQGARAGSAFGADATRFGRVDGEDIEVEFLVELIELALCSDIEQIGGEDGEGAAVSGGVVTQGGFELWGHELQVAGGLEEMFETLEEFSWGGIVEGEADADA